MERVIVSKFTLRRFLHLQNCFSELFGPCSAFIREFHPCSFDSNIVLLVWPAWLHRTWRTNQLSYCGIQQTSKSSPRWQQV